jgi:hypothetical protein
MTRGTHPNTGEHAARPGGHTSGPYQADESRPTSEPPPQASRALAVLAPPAPLSLRNQRRLGWVACYRWACNKRLRGDVCTLADSTRRWHPLPVRRARRKRPLGVQTSYRSVGIRGACQCGRVPTDATLRRGSPRVVSLRGLVDEPGGQRLPACKLRDSVQRSTLTAVGYLQTICTAGAIPWTSHVCNGAHHWQHD